MNTLVLDVIEQIVNELIEKIGSPEIESFEEIFDCMNIVADNADHQIFANKTFENYDEVKAIIVAFDEFNSDTNNADFNYFADNELNKYLEIVNQKMESEEKELSEDEKYDLKYPEVEANSFLAGSHYYDNDRNEMPDYCY